MSTFTKTQNSPTDIASAYGLSVPSNPGTGQKIGIVNINGRPSDSNMTTLASNVGSGGYNSSTSIPDAGSATAGVTDGYINWVSVPTVSGWTQVPVGGGVTAEPYGDIAVIGSLCPNATILFYQSAMVPPGGITDSYNITEATIQGITASIKQATLDGCSVLSCSYGHAENDIATALGISEGDWLNSENSYIKAFNAAVADAIAAGVTIVAASGDFGSDDDDSIPGTSDPDPSPTVDFPGTHPDILCVGGTAVLDTISQSETVNGEATTVYTEIVWGGGNDQSKILGATGGGVSSCYSQPTYQAASDYFPIIAQPKTLDPNQNPNGYPEIKAYDPITGADHTLPSDGRIVPDLASLAYGWDLSTPFSDVSDSPGNNPIGTSLAAPTIASFIVWNNQTNSTSGLGSINESLYNLMAVASPSSPPVTDIPQNEGNNEDQIMTYFTSQNGFDACTGWGTPNSNFLTWNP